MPLLIGALLDRGLHATPHATAATLAGDSRTFAELDAELTGRTTEVIRTGGEFVAPAEVERAIAGHAAVADLAVVGLPDERWGEIVCAAVVPRTGASVEPASLRRHVAGRLAPHKHPAAWRSWTASPARRPRARSSARPYAPACCPGSPEQP